MAYETKPNTGSLFKNEGERKRENGPDYSGTCLVDGTEYFMDAWLKSAESGRKWMSFSFKPKQKQSAPAPRAPKREDLEDAPF
jgi:hypothetical protein